ncbi:MAG: ScaI family restriction endonuclease [Deltaproteobacteria bacterium]|nr:ScaI family restriction endonuclease [Deltaproteobacteria bacterium]
MNTEPAGGGSALSPYKGVPATKWLAVTVKLLEKHPLTPEFVPIVQQAWKDIFATRIGSKGYRIGPDIKLSPQIMGNYLHELIPLIVQDLHPGEWCRGRGAHDKDLVCLTNPRLSIEIKTSSHPTQIFGNRSYGQPPSSTSDIGKKGKSGYYLAINFEKFSKEGSLPKISQVRFGWLDHSDWIAQRAPTGQQAHVNPRADAAKLVRLYPANRVRRDPGRH